MDGATPRLLSVLDREMTDLEDLVSSSEVFFLKLSHLVTIKTDIDILDLKTLKKNKQTHNILETRTHTKKKKNPNSSVVLCFFSVWHS